jgi:hypothetical protein
MPEALEVGIFSHGRSHQMRGFISAEVLLRPTAMHRKKPDSFGKKGHFDGGGWAGQQSGFYYS